MATRYYHGGNNGIVTAAGSYFGGVAPIAGDTVVAANGARRMVGDASAATWAKFIVEDTFSGDGGTDDTYLKIAATDVEYSGQGSRFKLDLGGVNSTLRCRKTGVGTGGLPALILLANLNTTDFYLLGGSAGVGVLDPTEAPVFDRIYIGGESSLLSPDVSVGIGATSNRIIQVSGLCDYLGITEDIDVYGGTLTVDTSDALDVVEVFGGTLYLDRHGTLTELNMKGGLTDWSRTENTRVVTSPTIYAGAEFVKGSSVTFTNKLARSGRTQLVFTEE